MTRTTRTSRSMVASDAEVNLMAVAERTQETIDNGGTVTLKLTCGNLTLLSGDVEIAESEGCEIVFQFYGGGKLEVSSADYISAQDLDSTNPVLNFHGCDIEVELWEA